MRLVEAQTSPVFNYTDRSPGPVQFNDSLETRHDVPLHLIFYSRKIEIACPADNEITPTCIC